MTDLFTKTVTIYNDIPEMDEAPRRFVRSYIEKCHVYGGFVDKSDGTIRNVVDARTVTTKDVLRYLDPKEYAALTEEEQKMHFTVQNGDFVIFDLVEDEVSNAKEWSQLQTKYKENGMKITSVSPNIHGMAVDNITFTNA